MITALVIRGTQQSLPQNKIYSLIVHVCMYGGVINSYYF